MRNENQIYCSNCGTLIGIDDPSCVQCGYAQVDFSGANPLSSNLSVSEPTVEKEPAKQTSGEGSTKMDYCKTCGNAVHPNAIACLSCGCDPKRGNQHCQSCGVETKPEQIICIKCGVSLNSPSISSLDGKSVATIAYLTLIGFIIALIQHGSNKTKLGAYHLRQVVGLMVSGIGLTIILWILLLPMFGMGYRSAADYAVFIGILSFVGWVAMLANIIISFINAINGRAKPAPILGKLYEKWFENWFL